MPQSAIARRRLATLLVAALAVVACSPNSASGTPSPTPSPAASPTTEPTATTPVDELAIYRQIEDEIIEIRGLQPTARLTPTVIDGPTLVANLTAEFDRTNKPDDLANDEALLTALGLLEPGTSLRDAYLDLQGSQVIGYYSAEDKALFVVSRSGGLGPTEKATFAHEFTHALQDQNFDLDSLDIDDLSNGDRALGRLALVEGDAVAAQTEWMLAHLTTDELTQLIGEASDPEVLAAFARAPAILRETSLFPYQAGLQFVESLRADGGFDRVNEAFRAPPESTAQILHPATYPGTGPPVLEDLSGFADAAGTAWELRRQDTLGEFILRVWLSENGVREADAAAATPGWTSDRIGLFESGDDHVVLLVTDWESSTDADAFEAAGRAAVAGQAFDTVIRVSTVRVVLVFGTHRTAVDGISGQVRTGGCC